MTDDLLSLEIDDGADIDVDYDALDIEDAPKEKILTLGYGKAETSSKNLLNDL